MKVVIVGGVAGGATAATRIRRMDEAAEIIIFERSKYISYANCGLPYYIGDYITDQKDLTLQTPKSMWNRYRIDVRVSHEVIDINVNDKKVIVKDLLSGRIFEETYDKLLLSPGAKPRKLNFLCGKDNVLSLRTVEDTYKIKNYIDSKNVKNALIIGGGFIGIEMAENLSNLGIDITIVQKSNHLLEFIDKDIASLLHEKVRNKGVKVLLNTDVVELSNNNSLNYDLILVSIGVSPDNSLAIKAGLSLTKNGSIKVNNKMETSEKDIYAVGDAVEIYHRIVNKNKSVTLAANATKEARIAADNICGMNKEYQGTLSTSILKVFDLTVAATGINEEQAISAGFRYEKVILTQANHASYYPGATPLTLKVIYEKDTLKILGAQALGYDGVDKRIDVIATAMFSGLKATLLKDLDLAYAPPYSSSKDPVNMAGFIIDNIEQGVVKQFSFDEIQKIEKEDVTLLDVRTVKEYNDEHASGFINISLDNLRDNLDLLDIKKKVYVMCQSGMRSYLATRILKENGFDAYNFIGGYKIYKNLYNDI